MLKRKAQRNAFLIVRHTELAIKQDSNLGLCKAKGQFICTVNFVYISEINKNIQRMNREIIPITKNQEMNCESIKLHMQCHLLISSLLLRCLGWGFLGILT